MKTEAELRDKLRELLALDATQGQGSNELRATIHSKTAACKTLLWALGENDDDRWYITAHPGPPLSTKVTQ
jgi:hypothetical protein